METEVIGVPPAVMIEAYRVLLDMEPLHLMIAVFGVSLVLLFSLLYIFRHSKEGKL